MGLHQKKIWLLKPIDQYYETTYPNETCLNLYRKRYAGVLEMCWCSLHHHPVQVPRTPPLPLLAHWSADRSECDAAAAAVRAVCLDSSGTASPDRGNLPGSGHHLPDVRASVCDLAYGLVSGKHPHGPGGSCALRWGHKTASPAASDRAAGTARHGGSPGLCLPDGLERRAVCQRADVSRDQNTRRAIASLQFVSGRWGLAPVRPVNGCSYRERNTRGDFVHGVPEIPDWGAERRWGQGIDSI